MNSPVNIIISKKLLLSFTIMVVIVLGVPFYWFSVRPSKIKKSCSSVTMKPYTQEEKDEAKKKFDDTDCSKVLAYEHKSTGEISLAYKEMGMTKEQAQAIFRDLTRDEAIDKAGEIMEERKNQCSKLEQIFSSPSEDWDRPSTDGEYAKCLRESGLNAPQPTYTE